jgi:hypothetical protein
MQGNKKTILDLKLLTEAITSVLRRQHGALCARCLTDMLGDAHAAENVDIRVAMVHLALGDGLTAGDMCGRCRAPESRRNPVMRYAQPAGRTMGAA